MREKHIIKYLAPSWFAVIMGTGGLANILYLWQDNFIPGKSAGYFLAALALISYFLVFIPWLLRWIFYYDYVRRDLHDPIAVNFFVTMPVATTIIGTNIYIIGNDFLTPPFVFFLCLLSWIIAVTGVTYFTFYTTFQQMRTENPPLPEDINFSWIMAPIANMAILLIGNPVLSMAIEHRPEWAVFILTLNTILLGIGFFLFIFISAIVFVRLSQYPLPPAKLTPSFGIFLSAVGLAVSAIIDTAVNSSKMGLLAATDLSFLIAAVIWGFGFWIVGIIVIICIHQIRKGGIPFSLGWWAFIFPLAAYTMASQKIAHYLHSILASGYTLVLTMLLILLWLYTFANTVKGIKRGNLFLGSPLPQDE